MNGQIEVKQEVEAVAMAEGAGARVHRVFPTGGLQHVDPFVLLDEFTVDPSAGFPDHPHGGFEAVTYMLKGAFRHRDDLGNDETVSAGGVQWFTAGRGIVHAELPGGDEVSHGLQLWVNLPRRLKETEPAYRAAGAEDIPEAQEGGVWTRTVIGDGSPVKLHTQVRYVDVILRPEAAGVELAYAEQISSGWYGLAYVLEGEIVLSGRAVTRGRAAIFGGGGELEVTAEQYARFVVIAGEPHGEPIRQRGSFVK